MFVARIAGITFQARILKSKTIIVIANADKLFENSLLLSDKIIYDQYIKINLQLLAVSVMDSSSINLHVHCVTLTQDFAYQHKISIPISTNSVYGKLLVPCTDAVVMNRVKVSLMAFRQAACQGNLLLFHGTPITSSFEF